ncbi:hypothetical protein Pelo_16711 [Pelomyxa schiedti]|nr:hypothetical protein Pelo_16711 [Pelomyxa schiedti]
MSHIDRCVVEPRVLFRDQVAALMGSSHPRCGRRSPAAILTAANDAPLLRMMVARWARGAALMQCVGPNCTVAVRLSMSTLGVIPAKTHRPTEELGCDGDGCVRREEYFTRYDGVCRCVRWLDSAHYIADPEPFGGSYYLKCVVTGERVCVPGMTAETVLVLECRGQWIVDSVVLVAWRVARGGRGSPLGVSQPRKLVPCGEMGTSYSMTFGHFVSDWCFDVCYNGFGYCVYHLIDIAEAFGSGVMVPMDIVQIPLGDSLEFIRCFWGSRSVLAMRKNSLFRVQGKYAKMKLLSEDVMAFEMLDNFAVVSRKGLAKACEVWDLRPTGSETVVKPEPTVIAFPQLCGMSGLLPTSLSEAGDLIVVDTGNKVHVLDASSGLVVFTMRNTLNIPEDSHSAFEEGVEADWGDMTVCGVPTVAGVSEPQSASLVVWDEGSAGNRKIDKNKTTMSDQPGGPRTRPYFPRAAKRSVSYHADPIRDALVSLHQCSAKRPRKEISNGSPHGTNASTAETETVNDSTDTTATTTTTATSSAATPKENPVTRIHIPVRIRGGGVGVGASTSNATSSPTETMMMMPSVDVEEHCNTASDSESERDYSESASGSGSESSSRSSDSEEEVTADTSHHRDFRLPGTGEITGIPRANTPREVIYRDENEILLDDEEDCESIHFPGSVCTAPQDKGCNLGKLAERLTGILKDSLGLHDLDSPAVKLKALLTSLEGTGALSEQMLQDGQKLEQFCIDLVKELGTFRGNTMLVYSRVMMALSILRGVLDSEPAPRSKALSHHRTPLISAPRKSPSQTKAPAPTISKPLTMASRTKAPAPASKAPIRTTTTARTAPPTTRAPTHNQAQQHPQPPQPQHHAPSI